MGQENFLSDNQQHDELSSYEAHVESVTPLLDSVTPEDSTSETLRAHRAFLLRLAESTATAQRVAQLRGDISSDVIGAINKHYQVSVADALLDARQFTYYPLPYIDDSSEFQSAELASELLTMQAERVTPLVVESLRDHIREKQAELEQLQSSYQSLLATLTPDELLTARTDSVAMLPVIERTSAADNSVVPEPVTRVMSIAEQAATVLAEKDTRVSTGKFAKILGASVMNFLMGRPDRSHSDHTDGHTTLDPISVMTINRI